MCVCVLDKCVFMFYTHDKPLENNICSVRNLFIILGKHHIHKCCWSKRNVDGQNMSFISSPISKHHSKKYILFSFHFRGFCACFGISDVS